MMEFSIYMGLIGIVLISIALGMLIQRRLVDPDEVEAGRDR